MQNFGQKRWFCDHEINSFHRTALKLGTSTRYYTGGLHAKFEANSFNITRVMAKMVTPNRCKTLDSQMAG